MSTTQSYHVIIIGAGWTGLAAAKTYLQLFPSTSLTIVDADSSVGGVWSASRVYPGLIADSTAGTFDYSDFPMDEAVNVDPWADLPAEKVSEYLEKYADHFDLRKRLRLSTKVVKVEREGKCWKVDVELNGVEGTLAEREILFCDKLISATGATSTPNMPEGIHWSKFEGPVMHSKDVGSKHQLLTSDATKRVTVVGGSKSAIDVVNLCALAGKQVDWVIRKEGYGPIVLFQARTLGYHAGIIKAARASVILAPNLLDTESWCYKFLYSGKNRLGTWIIKRILGLLSSSTMSMYEGNENTMKIAPELRDLTYSASGISIIRGDDFLNLVREGTLVHVYRASVTSLAERSVHLSNGQIIPCDAAVFATGWQVNQPVIFDKSILPDVGLPYDTDMEPADETKYWSELNHASQSKLEAQFPMLAQLPEEVIEYDKQHHKVDKTTPFRLYRGMVPPKLAERDDRSLVVLGTFLSSIIPIYAEISSLWAVAYLESLPFETSTSKILNDRPAMEKDISFLESWNILRYRHTEGKYFDGTEQCQDFANLLMRDLGLRDDRKRLAAERNRKKGLLGLRVWVREWFTPYQGVDYRGMVDEYKATWGL